MKLNCYCSLFVVLLSAVHTAKQSMDLTYVTSRIMGKCVAHRSSMITSTRTCILHVLICIFM